MLEEDTKEIRSVFRLSFLTSLVILLTSSSQFETRNINQALEEAQKHNAFFNDNFDEYRSYLGELIFELCSSFFEGIHDDLLVENKKRDPNYDKWADIYLPIVIYLPPPRNKCSIVQRFFNERPSNFLILPQ